MSPRGIGGNRCKGQVEISILDRGISPLRVTHLNSPSSHMWQKHHVWITRQTRVDLWFFFENVEAGGKDFTVVKCLNKSGFVHDGTSGGVDNDHAIFHLREFSRADNVAGVFLGNC